MKNAPRTGPLLAAGLVVVSLGLFACGESDPTPDARYTTQGRVYSVVTPESPASEFKIHHEAIPNFVNGQGEVVGMNSHPMSFPRVAEGIDVQPLEVGQPVRFTFDVTWGESSPTWVITELELLPDDTRFAFEMPEGDESAPTPDSSGG
ncbi:MAG: hypothetical protein NCW75_12990 [Phycisphaera sp.]|nr:MAG: hypothetical protein NCW75_12990 [Phycisphaera sp.]